MILTEKQKESFEEAARPLMKWASVNCDPHVKVIVDCGRAELLESVNLFPTDDYLVPRGIGNGEWLCITL